MSRYFPLLVFLLVGSIGLATTIVVYRAEEAAEQARFEALADDTVDRIGERLRRSLALLRATNAYFTTSRGSVSRQDFISYVDGLEIEQRFDGLQGLGFARFLPAGQERDVEAELERNYDWAIKAWPETDQDRRAVIVLLEPHNFRNEAALGYDMFSEPLRRRAMQTAIETGQDTASAPVSLVQEVTSVKQAGFLVYTPLYRSGTGIAYRAEPIGFVYAAFRAGDFHQAALERPDQLPLVVETRDTTDGQSELLFHSEGYDEMSASSSFTVERKIPIAGRSWTITAHETQAFFDASRYWRTTVLGAIFLLLSAALAAVARLQARAMEAAREIQVLTEKAVEEKDLLLHETKHRIKNSITRILAMARQTALNSETLEDFSRSFEARMQAMANAQDLLTRSGHRNPDLETLLRGELQQVFGDHIADGAVDGPAVELGDTAIQALGLTFHELATNALKYGGVSGPGGSLKVSWELINDGDHLSLEWIEERPEAAPDAEPDVAESTGRKGFGTRLIDASIKLELGGTIERAFSASRSRIFISIPLAEPAEEAG
ncbi:MAG: CHASE domain-containing protein [Nisaea sp.]|uniref:CHASE domain-containing protein n=1 Tax=Nisaea sp. TaxID=2024842 RepID=UPI001B001F18|nr:CHASE domain-containing protein [Nisaea sp.]MBO6561012.1 CHASE domain-containing protein [Nisaea sp.]